MITAPRRSFSGISSRVTTPFSTLTAHPVARPSCPGNHVLFVPIPQPQAQGTTARDFLDERGSDGRATSLCELATDVSCNRHSWRRVPGEHALPHPMASQSLSGASPNRHMWTQRTSLPSAPTHGVSHGSLARACRHASARTPRNIEFELMIILLSGTRGSPDINLRIRTSIRVGTPAKYPGSLPPTERSIHLYIIGLTTSDQPCYHLVSTFSLDK